MKPSDLRDKKVAVLGLSVEGLSTAKFLLKNGIEFTVLDKKEIESLGSDAEKLRSSQAIKWHLGESYLDDLEKYEVIFRTPGFPLWKDELKRAEKNGVIITSQTKLFFDLCPCPIIGVTGTKGKGTTSTLIFEMLAEAGSDVHLGGNIGQPPLEFLDKLKPESKVVLELSSFQLEDLKKSPSIAVILMVTSDHLSSQSAENPNYHQSTIDYLNSKMNLVNFQNPRDVAVINDDYENSRQFSVRTKGQMYYFSRHHPCTPGTYVEGRKIIFRSGSYVEKVCTVNELQLRGQHNWENVCAAITVAKIEKVSNGSIVKVLKTFRGLEHRLELVSQVGGVSYYDDSFSTTPETAIAALNSFSEPLTIILGGWEKGSDFTELGRVLHGLENLRSVILIGSTAKKIEASIMASGGFSAKTSVVRNLTDMSSIVKTSSKIAKKGDVVLLSPACASFDMFKNYKERGDQFKKEVNKL